MDPSPENNMPKKQLSILLEFIKSTYTSITKRLELLLKDSEIIYNLLLALFKLNTKIYTTFPEINQPRYTICNFGEKRECRDRTKYFHIKYQYLNWDSKLLGESTVMFEIEKFKGVKKISLLEVFPLKYLPTKKEVRI
jgi:hypothetical protein